MLKRFFQTPQQEYLFIFLAATLLLLDLFVQDSPFDLAPVILAVALLGSIPILIRAFSILLNWGISIDILYLSALIALFAVGEIHSVVFVSIILAMGRLLDLRVRSIPNITTEKFCRELPEKAFRQNRNVYDEIPVQRIKGGDILIVKEKVNVPVDGVVVFGEVQVNEMSVTGLSTPITKVLNDKVFSPSMVDSGTIKIRAIGASKDSVFVQKIKLMEEIGKKRSCLQYFTDKLTEYFLPFVFIAGIVVYLVTDNIIITSALFLVVCQKGITVVVPLQFKKVFNTVAKYGVIIRNGKKFETLGKIKTVVLDKTDILTFGSFQIKDIHIEEGISKTDFWTSVAIAEKYSEGSINKILFREAVNHVQTIPDAHKYQVYKGSGVYAKYGRDNILVGNKKLLSEVKIKFPRGFQKRLDEKNKKKAHTVIFVAINNIFVGSVDVVDIPEKSLHASVKELRKIGVEKVVIFTNDDETIARNITTTLGIDEFRCSLTPEEKREELKRLSKISSVAVVGDGGGGYSTILRRGVDIAMGKDCIAMPAKNSDIIILNDNLRLLPKLILSSRSLTRTTYGNIGIWFLVNFSGVAFVIEGIITPVFAVLYSFILEFTHLFPILRLPRICKIKAR